MLRELKAFYKKNNRAHLPWRRLPANKKGERDPYKILVSEIMLQQTQVDRVVPFYTAFITQFPTAKALAEAPLSKVLIAWQGLGYNRRAKYLHEAAKILASATSSSKRSSGRPSASTRPFSPEDVASLPGVGPYTKGAVLAFAFNEPEVFIETNIRTVLFHHAKDKDTMIYHSKVSDAQLLPIVARLLKKSKMEPRDFYAAMMDYGAHLKRQGVRLNKKSAHYQKQSAFEGSRRQKRAAALRAALTRGASERELLRMLNCT